MATRIEKIYKTNSLVAINNILNYVKEYIEKKKKIGEAEKEFIEDVTTEIDYFFNKNGITDLELRNAVGKGN